MTPPSLSLTVDKLKEALEKFPGDAIVCIERTCEEPFLLDASDVTYSPIYNMVSISSQE